MMSRMLERLMACVWGRRLLGLASRSQVLSGAFLMLRGHVGNELSTVLRGMLAHRERLRGNVVACEAMLRRYVHGIEKGLCMPEPRRVFATAYIEETVEAFRALAERSRAGECQSTDTLRGTLTWARAALQAYFALDFQDARVQRAKRRFEEVCADEAARGDDHRPRPYADLPPLKVSYESLLELALHRHSVRWFEQKPVPADLVDKAVAVASRAPSACNRQAYVFRVCDDPELVRSVLRLTIGTAGFQENVPCVVLLVGDLAAYEHERDRHLVYVDCGLAAMLFMLALETVGLASCPVNWPALPQNDARVRKVLRLSPTQQVTLAICVGYPSPGGMLASSARKSVEALRERNLP